MAVEFNHPVAFGVCYAIGEHNAALRFAALLEGFLQAVSVKDIVAENERRVVIPHKVFAEYKGLSQAVGHGLLAIAKLATDFRTVAQELFKKGQILRCGYDQYLVDSGLHQGGQGVVYHGLVVHGHQLFADSQCQRVETGALAPGEDDSFHSAFSNFFG